MKKILTGLCLFFISIFLIMKNITVYFNLYSFYYLGMIINPEFIFIITLLIGVALCVIKEKSTLGVFFIILSVIILFLELIMSVHFYFRQTGLIPYISLFSCFVIGVSLIIKGLLFNKNN